MRVVNPVPDALVNNGPSLDIRRTPSPFCSKIHPQIARGSLFFTPEVHAMWLQRLLISLIADDRA